MDAHVVLVWGCIPDAERVACYAMSDASALVLGYVLKANITAGFLVDSPSWFETRRDAWVACYAVEEGTVEIDEQQVEVYFTNRPWMLLLAACRLEGDCQLDEPRCLEFVFYNQPV